MSPLSQSPIEARPSNRARKLADAARSAAQVRAYQTHPDVIALRVERVRTWVDRLIWTGLVMGLAFTMANVAEFAAGDSSPPWSGQPNASVMWVIAWLLDPMVSLVLIGVLLGEQTIARQRLKAGIWVRITKWTCLAATYAMNTWSSWAARDAAEILLHSVPPLVVFVTAEAITDLRHQITTAVHRAYTNAHDGAADQAVRGGPPASWGNPTASTEAGRGAGRGAVPPLPEPAVATPVADRRPQHGPVTGQATTRAAAATATVPTTAPTGATTGSGQRRQFLTTPTGGLSTTLAPHATTLATTEDRSPELAGRPVGDHSGDHAGDRLAGDRSATGAQTPATTSSGDDQATGPATGLRSGAAGQRKSSKRPAGEVVSRKRGKATAEENAQAVEVYLASVAEGRPLSKRELAIEFGRSPTWARDRILQAGPQVVGRQPGDHAGGDRAGDHSSDHAGDRRSATGQATTPDDRNSDRDHAGNHSAGDRAGDQPEMVAVATATGGGQ